MAIKGKYINELLITVIILYSFTIYIYTTKKPEEHYVEEELGKGTNFEQKNWEEDHLNKAIMKFGAKDAKQSGESVSRNITNVILLQWMLLVMI